MKPDASKQANSSREANDFQQQAEILVQHAAPRLIGKQEQRLGHHPGAAGDTDEDGSPHQDG